MYKVAKIYLKPLSDNKDDIIENVDSLLSMMYKNGQILGEWIVETYDENYVATVITTDNDSLDEKYFNSYILKALQSFEINVEILCDDPTANDSCHCNDHSFYVLAVFPYDVTSPILCGDCGREIPLIHIPYIFNEEEHYSILSFQKLFHAVDTIWLESLSDRFSKRQIIDVNSQLNKRGIDICSDLEKKLNKLVYYYLSNPIGGWYQYEKNNKFLEKCPKCGGKFETVNNICVNKICHRCRLAFVDSHEDS